MHSVQIFILTFLHGQLSHNEKCYYTDISLKWTPRDCPCHSLVIYFAFYELDMYLRLPLNTGDNGFSLRDSWLYSCICNLGCVGLVFVKKIRGHKISGLTLLSDQSSKIRYLLYCMLILSCNIICVFQSYISWQSFLFLLLGTINEFCTLILTFTMVMELRRHFTPLTVSWQFHSINMGNISLVQVILGWVCLKRGTSIQNFAVFFLRFLLVFS